MLISEIKKREDFAKCLRELSNAVSDLHHLLGVPSDTALYGLLLSASSTLDFAVSHSCEFVSDEYE